MKGLKSTVKGMSLTMSHMRKAFSKRKIQDIRDNHFFDNAPGITTLTYPYQAIPVPDHGRYQLFNEIEDCIVCDKCAKICPVDCIEIEPIKSVGEFGKTSDGTSKRIYAARFDIDMAKCCFCGLCTTVCPTECLTMTDEYDFSVFDLGKMNFGFGNLSESEAEEKRREWEENQAKKEALKAEASVRNSPSQSTNPSPNRPMRPSGMPVQKPASEEAPKLEESTDAQLPPPVNTTYSPKARPRPTIPSKPASNQNPEKADG